MSRRATARAAVVAGSVFSAAIVVLAAVAAWPIYAGSAFVILVAVCALVAAGIAIGTALLRWRFAATAAVTAGALLVLGVPLAVPGRLGGPADLLRGLGELGTGLVLAWKDLLTVDLPVGDYRNVLVPALVVFLVGTVALLRLSWREGRVALLAVPLGLVMLGFGLFFGRTVVSAPLALGPITLGAPRESALGLAGLFVCFAWLAWRTHHERVRALARAAESGEVQVGRRARGSDRRRTALGAAMLAGAVVIAGAVVPMTAAGSERQTLRWAVGPEISLTAATSPLAEYRALFTDERIDDVLFTVEAGGAAPERVRLAVLDSYDGEVFRTGSGAPSRFVRVPAVRPAGEGAEVEATIVVGDLPGIWMPSAGRLVEAEFQGARAVALADRFYYSSGADAAVQTVEGGWQDGDRYRLRAVEPTPLEVSAAVAPGTASAAVEAPESLRTWVERHRVGEDGAALEQLVTLLRERGYLSHALTVGEEQPAWAAELGDYRFQPSTSGHSLARVDQMFTRLLEREDDPRAQASGNYVAAVGDDEQFAVAAALIAQELGFPSRVVVGTRLSAPAGLSACEDGVCRAGDLAAWVEVQDAGGAWVALDASPQYAQSPSLDVTEQRDPKVVTDVLPDAVEDVVPPDPVQEDSASEDRDEEETGTDLSWLWPVLRVAGLILLALLLLLGPFALVLGAKAARRRARRRAADGAARIAGGWEEYVDAAVDAGRSAPGILTRSELASRWGTPHGDELAVAADRAAFSGGEPTPAETTRYWETVDEERRHLMREGGVWRRIVRTVSLRSFVRQVSPDAGARDSERGRRRDPIPARQAS